MKDMTQSSDIARLAYQIWEHEGRPHGCDQQHWLEAERLLNTPRPAKPAAKNGSRLTTGRRAPVKKLLVN